VSARPPLDKAARTASAERQGKSDFVGVSWRKERRKWQAQIRHGGKEHYLGCFGHEREAARAVDTAARRLRGDDAHGGRAGTNWNRLNFPTDTEVKRAKNRSALIEAAAAKSEQQGPSEFVGVHWIKRNRKWVAVIKHDRKKRHLGLFDDEREAARVFDTAARRLRGADAHGGRSGTNRNRLNFPTKREEAARAKALAKRSSEVK
jgi:hypothetical protein